MTGDEKIEICVLQILDETQSNEKKRFIQCKQEWENNFLDLDSRLEIDYRYEYVGIDIKEYPKNCEACSISVLEKIRELVADKDYAIILDVVLVDKKDTQIVLKEKKKILSQFLYNNLYERCIPYTNYDAAVKFRQEWSKGVIPKKEAYDRDYLEGDMIDETFEAEIFKMLKID